MGMSSTEWSRYMHDSLGVPMEPEEISAAVVARLEADYRERVPLLPGAVEAVRALAERWPLGARLVREPAADRPGAGARPAWPGSSGSRSRPRRCRAASRRPTSTSRRPAAGAGSEAVRGGRGLHQRDPLRERRGDARGRDPAPGLPAIGRSARASPTRSSTRWPSSSRRSSELA